MKHYSLCVLLAAVFAIMSISLKAQPAEFIPVELPTTPGYFRTIAFADQNIGYALTSRCVILKTTDGGDTWEQMTEPIPETEYTSVKMEVMDADHIFVALSTGNMMKSYDGGVTWTVTPQCFQTSLLDMFFLNENDGFGLIDYGKILKTNNGGDSWTQFHLSTLNPMYAMLYPSAIEFTDELTGYVFAAGDCGKVFKTEDGGDSWYDATPGMEILSLNDGCFPSEETGFAVGAYGTAISTHDSGNTWEPMDVGTEVTVWDYNGPLF